METRIYTEDGRRFVEVRYGQNWLRQEVRQSWVARILGYDDAPETERRLRYAMSLFILDKLKKNGG